MQFMDLSTTYWWIAITFARCGSLRMPAMQPPCAQWSYASNLRRGYLGRMRVCECLHKCGCTRICGCIMCEWAKAWIVCMRARQGAGRGRGWCDAAVGAGDHRPQPAVPAAGGVWTIDPFLIIIFYIIMNMYINMYHIIYRSYRLNIYRGYV